jgi:hypothetical protein
MTKMQDKEIAKTIILQIVRQAGGVLDNKTNLYKAFYYAHLHFADRRGYYLSTWPIVRMPRGPGIDSFDILVGELMAEGKLECKSIERGDCSGFRFSICDGVVQDNLPVGAEEAIGYALKRVQGRTAALVSAVSHVDSRAWREATDGEELNIYTDLLDDAQYEQEKRRTEKIATAMKAVW